MSIGEVGAQLREVVTKLQTPELAQALGSLTQAGELIANTARGSARLPAVSAKVKDATDRITKAGSSLRLAEEQINTYLAAAGLATAEVASAGAPGMPRHDRIPEKPDSRSGGAESADATVRGQNARPDDCPAEPPEPPAARALVPARAILERFGLSPGNFSRMRCELPALVLGDKTYRFPEPYLEAYEGWLGDRKANPRNAGDFAKTWGAIDAIDAVRTEFAKSLEELISPDPVADGSVDAEEFAKLVGVNQQTVDDWRRAGLEVHTPQGWRARRSIGTAALNKFCSWRYPASFLSEEAKARNSLF